MNSPSTTMGTAGSPTGPGPNRVVLEVKGLGPVPSLKNHKRSVIQRSGKAKPITDPLVKKWMQQAQLAFESQLICASLTGDGETRTGASRRCWIVSLLPDDDCWTKLPDITIKSELCEPGQEGATIVIERL